jgi:[ribosomal protein S5]-alanine N-acetyltransferase
MSRLTLSPYTIEDLMPLFHILKDPAAMQFTYVPPSREACSRRLVAWESQRAERGFAPWVVRLSATSQVIGWGGLGVDPEDPNWGPEVVYAFAPSFWGNGLASELVAHTVGYAFSQHRLPSIDAFVHPENRGSIKVLQSSGFSLCGYESVLRRNRFRINCEHSAA